VVITGLGVIAPNGIGKDSFWEAIKEGKSGIGKITRFDTSDFPTKIAGEVKDFDPTKYISGVKPKRMSRFAQFAVASAKMAVKDAGVDLNSGKEDRVGVVFGTAIGGMDIAEEQHDLFREKGIGSVSPFLAGAVVPNASSGAVSLALKVSGPSITISTGCSSALNAIGYSFDLLRNNRADVIIAGGTEAPLAPLTFGSFGIARQLSERNEEPSKASRPYDRERDGFVLGEGGAAIVLETREHALKRGAPIYCEIVGYGSSNDVYSMFKVESSGKGAAKAIIAALKDADLEPKDLHYVNAHAISSRQGDRKETNALKIALKEKSYKIPVSSVKSTIGHSLGASGGFQCVAASLALKNNCLPPTMNYENPDPVCDLDYVPNKFREREIEVALLNSFGIGGSNASLIIKKDEKRGKQKGEVQ
jgi:3-oxoacyl-[acyl-carrier-protein] synthase II